MNIRDYGTDWYRVLERVKSRLEIILSDCGTCDELVTESLERSTRAICNIMAEMDVQLELGMDDE